MRNFSWEKLPHPIVCLAPMAGYTDSAFRRIVKSIAPDIVCFSELTSINALEYNSKKTLKMLKYDEAEKPLIIQLFGNDPDYFVDAGKKLEKLGASGIDINMGCPAKKITRNCQGSALLNDPKLAGEIINKLTKAVRIPISAKIRIGYNKYDEQTFIKFIKTLESAGIQNLTIHGRTTKQAYSDKANFEPIYLAKSLLKISVIGNGDIDSPEKALKMLTSPDGKTTLDGLMIGRATIGNPWIMKEISDALSDNHAQHTTTPTSSNSTPSFTSPQLQFKKKLPIIKRHFKLALKLHGERVGILEMRKHLAGYITGIEGAKSRRQQIMQENDPKKIIEILESIQP